MDTESYSVKITGAMVATYFICKRKLWLFSKGMDMENLVPTDDVLIGRFLSETTFKREKFKELHIGDSAIDFLKFKDKIIVHEVKKSDKFQEAHIWQVKYYIYLLKKHGLDVAGGVVHYPKKMRKVDVNFTEEDEEKIENALKEIKNVLSLPDPPPPVNKSYCKRCSYYEFCYI